MSDSDRMRFLCNVNARYETLVKYDNVVYLGIGIYDITRHGKENRAGEFDARDPEGG